MWFNKLPNLLRHGGCNKKYGFNKSENGFNNFFQPGVPPPKTGLINIFSRVCPPADLIRAPGFDLSACGGQL